jgi:hypothetical protein
MRSNVADSDLYVFGPPGSGSISTRYGSVSGSGSNYHSKTSKKKLDSYCFADFFMTFYR